MAPKILEGKGPDGSWYEAGDSFKIIRVVTRVMDRRLPLATVRVCVALHIQVGEVKAMWM